MSYQSTTELTFSESSHFDKFIKKNVINFFVCSFNFDQNCGNKSKWKAINNEKERQKKVISKMVSNYEHIIYVFARVPLAACCLLQPHFNTWTNFLPLFSNQHFSLLVTDCNPVICHDVVVFVIFYFAATQFRCNQIEVLFPINICHFRVTHSKECVCVCIFGLVSICAAIIIWYLCISDRANTVCHLQSSNVQWQTNSNIG